jgi:hypothetical protein
MNNLLPLQYGRGDKPSENFEDLAVWKPEKADYRNPANVPYGLGMYMCQSVCVVYPCVYLFMFM